MKSLIHLSRLAPAVGLLANAIRFRGLRCGLNVEILGSADLIYGRHVSLGQGTRVDLPQGSIVELGENVSVSRSVHFAPDVARRIAIGDGTTVQDGCRVYGDVEIGRRCILAPNVLISSGSHAFDRVPHRPIQEQEQLKPIEAKPIKIFSDCWIGINSVILPGVSIGRGSVIGANSVVTKDIAPYCVAAGNPARVVGRRLEFAPKSWICASNENDWPYFYDGFNLSLAEGETGFIAHTPFVLAMMHPHPKAIRLSLLGAQGEIAFAGNRRQLPKRADIVEFKYAEESTPSPFLRFEVYSSCRLFGAEII